MGETSLKLSPECRETETVQVYHEGEAKEKESKTHPGVTGVGYETGRALSSVFLGQIHQNGSGHHGGHEEQKENDTDGPQSQNALKPEEYIDVK